VKDKDRLQMSKMGDHTAESKLVLIDWKTRRAATNGKRRLNTQGGKGQGR